MNPVKVSKVLKSGVFQFFFFIIVLVGIMLPSRLIGQYSPPDSAMLTVSIVGTFLSIPCAVISTIILDYWSKAMLYEPYDITFNGKDKFTVPYRADLEFSKLHLSRTGYVTGRQFCHADDPRSIGFNWDGQHIKAIYVGRLPKGKYEPDTAELKSSPFYEE